MRLLNEQWTENDQQSLTPRPGTSLRVLVIGDSHSTDHVDELLNSLTSLGHTIEAVESFSNLPITSDPSEAVAQEKAFLKKIARHVEQNPPDIVIHNSDDPQLFRSVIACMPPQTRILDSLALDVFKGLRDISGQLEATRTRLQSVELIKEVLMSGPGISLMVVDEDLKILEISNSILERAKMALEDCIGRPCHWLLRKGLRPCHCSGDTCIAQEVLLNERSVHTVKEAGSREETRHYFTVSGYPLRRDEDGKRNVLIVWKDINQGMTQVLSRQAQNIQESFFRTLQQDKMVALGQLAAAAVHEINNPIQGILTFAKLMRHAFNKESLSEREFEKFRSYLDLIAGESARCGQILRNLLSFARMDKIEKSAVDINPVVDEVFMLVRNRAELQGITLVRRMADELLPMFGDRGHIKQALLNLIINAMDAMPNGGVLTVAAQMDSDREKIRITVTDTGTGVPKSLHGSIWEPFVTTKDQGKGVGLGLSVVYGIVTQHGGTVDMQSEENRGTVFGINLPVYRREEETQDS